MPTSVRLDPKAEILLRHLSTRRGRTKSEVIRDGLMALAKEEDSADSLSPYEVIEPFIGCARGGPKDLSERTGQKFGKLLIDRKPL